MIKIIQFEASWCGQCRKFKPIVEKIKEQYKDVIFETLDIDKNMELAKELNIAGLPAFVFYKDNQLIQVLPSCMNKNKIVEVINGLRTV